jgi:hypothetical protein
MSRATTAPVDRKTAGIFTIGRRPLSMFQA